MRVLLIFFCCLAPVMAWAGELPQPVGEPVLTISGNIENTNRGGEAVFDIDALKMLGVVSMSTTSPWYNNRTNFEGVPLQKLIDYVGARGTVANVVALNDYTTIIPLSDFKEYNVILALKRNGEYMRIRDRGPLFIVYPYDSTPDLDNKTYYSRSAWQVRKMRIE